MTQFVSALELIESSKFQTVDYGVWLLIEGCTLFIGPGLYKPTCLLARGKWKSLVGKQMSISLALLGKLIFTILNTRRFLHSKFREYLIMKRVHILLWIQNLRRIRARYSITHFIKPPWFCSCVTGLRTWIKFSHYGPKSNWNRIKPEATVCNQPC